METLSRIGVAGLSGMGQNLALNIADKGFPVSVYNQTASKVEEIIGRAASDGGLPVTGQPSPAKFVLSIQRPRSIILVKDRTPLDQTISTLSQILEPGDSIIDGGNEWYENTERRIRDADARGLLYLGMGIAGGENSARHGPSLMPGGSFKAYQNIADILARISAQADDGPCVTYVGQGGSGNFVEVVHNGIEFGNVQLISEAYEVMKTVGGFSNLELAEIFEEWNRGELESFLIMTVADICRVKDVRRKGGLIDEILDKAGITWTIDPMIFLAAGTLSLSIPTIGASIGYAGGIKDEGGSSDNARVPKEAGRAEGEISQYVGVSVDKKRLIDDVRQALYASMVSNYAQGMELLGAKSEEKSWNLNLRELARIWKGGSLLRAKILDEIKKAYERNRGLKNLLFDPEIVREMVRRHEAWRRVRYWETEARISAPAMDASFFYFHDRVPRKVRNRETCLTAQTIRLSSSLD